MKFLSGLFNRANKAPNEIELLRRHIDLLDHILSDYRNAPMKYRSIGPAVVDAYNQMVVEKAKLEMRYLYLTRFH